MDGTMIIIATLVLIFTISCLIFKAVLHNLYEKDNLKYSVKRLESRIDELYSYYNSINTKIKEYDHEIFKRKVKELCEKHNLLYKIENEHISTHEVTHCSITYTCRKYSTILRIQTESLSTEFLRELSRVCEYELLKAKGESIIEIKIKERENEY